MNAISKQIFDFESLKTEISNNANKMKTIYDDEFLDLKIELLFTK